MRTLSLYAMFVCNIVVAQTGLYVNGAAASLRVAESAFLSVNGDFENLNCDPVMQVRFNGTLYLAGSLKNYDTLKFSPASPSTAHRAKLVFHSTPQVQVGFQIGGTAKPHLWQVEIDRPGTWITMFNDVYLYDTIEFKNGDIAMNQRKWILRDPVGAPTVINHPYIKGENNNRKFRPTGNNDTGMVIYHTTFTHSMNLNPGNIGIRIEGPVDYGSAIKIIRGFKSQGAGRGSIASYYELHSNAYSLVNNTVAITYLFSDMQYMPPNYFSPYDMTPFVSPVTGNFWTALKALPGATLAMNPPQPTVGQIRVALAELAHPNVNLSGHSLRIAIADPRCPTPPISSLPHGTFHLCAGITTSLDAGNTPQIPNTSVKWEWNTNPPAYTQTMAVIPNSNYQTFKVKLKDIRGCITLDSTTYGPAAPAPQVTYLNHLNVCSGDSITIKDTVTIAAGTFSNSWLFSDTTNIRTNQNVFKKKFGNPGTYSYTLFSVSNHGCQTTITQTGLTVYSPPIASFTHTYDCATDFVSFTNTSDPNGTSAVIASSSWWLGPATSTLMHPAFNYTAGGTYPVTLIVTSNFGCKDTAINPVVVPAKNHAAFSKNNGCDRDTVMLTNNSACNSGNCTYTWDTGDSFTSGRTDLKHVYSAPGMYVVKLKLTSTSGCPDSTTSVIFINPIPAVTYTIDKSNLCPGGTANFLSLTTISSGTFFGSWDFGNGTYGSGLSGSAVYPSPGTYSIQHTAVSDSGCTDNFKRSIIVRTPPVAKYNVAATCSGDSSKFVSFSVGNNLVHSWYFGNSVTSGTTTSYTRNYLYPTAGVFTSSLIVIDNFGCGDTLSQPAVVNQSPKSVLKGQIASCGTVYVLDAGNPGSSYLWSPGNYSTQTIQCNASESFSVLVTAANGCTVSSQVNLKLHAPVYPHLGNDTVVCGSIPLDAGYPGSTYHWSNLASTQTILAQYTGVFYVKVTDQNGCTGSDSIHVVALPVPTISLGPDISRCKPKNGQFFSPMIADAVDYLWSSGAQTRTFQTHSSGQYWLEITGASGCKNRDTINIELLNSPVVALGHDRSSCGPLLLHANHPTHHYQWSTGDTVANIYAKSSGRYSLKVTNPQTGCSDSASVWIVIHPLVQLNLGNDTAVCANTGFLLNTGNPSSTAKWSTGSTGPVLGVNTSGVYGVTVTNNGGCSATDYINVTVKPLPAVNLWPRQRYLCNDEALIITHGSTGELNWHTPSGIINGTNSISARHEGHYRLTAIADGCMSFDTLRLVRHSYTTEPVFLVSTIDTVNKPVQFINLTEPAPFAQTWFFGDGTMSTDFEPIHTYVLPHDFSVTLEVSDGYCTNRLTKSLNVLFREARQNPPPRAAVLQLLSFDVYPNPSADVVNVTYQLSEQHDVNIVLRDLSGKQLLQYNLKDSQDASLPVNELPPGIYFISLTSESPKGVVSKMVKFVRAE